ncbi:hypothetical protein [Limnoraphis robusta]|uniref:Uncharacterized protein n=1 Tax=Limnoraphis robusta CS-951 TaxID=1637645 RepID=A0A0J9EZ39_9CYAN|nr:hypothetical protein [Limnoraphis robusta]KMW70465.1 hypothetical protein WN50_35105 [Limnoraphis robusta CS-951]
MTSSDNIDQRLSAIETEMTQLREGQQTLSSQLENLTRISMSLVEVSRSQQQQISVLSQQADRDRSAWQAEIRQIWEYLLRQRPNGGSSS